MKRYQVSITETTTVYRTEYIEARNEEDAWEKAEDAFAFEDGGRSDEDFNIEITDVVED